MRYSTTNAKSMAPNVSLRKHSASPAYRLRHRGQHLLPKWARPSGCPMIHLLHCNTALPVLRAGLLLLSPPDHTSVSQYRRARPCVASFVIPIHTNVRVRATFSWDKERHYHDKACLYAY
jgi:hypothetical protein